MSVGKLRTDLKYVTVDGHRMHVFCTGNPEGQRLVLMSGSATAAPMYDFKVLYEKLEKDFRVIVIEKFGYGYSDLYEGPGDIDAVVSVQRRALEAAGERGPFFLLPHSMAGLEALRWAQLAPGEVAGIIGLDMATPKTYLSWGGEELERRIRVMEKTRALKDRGLLFWYPLSTRSLTREERIQQRLLWKRNAMNGCMVREALAVQENARRVASSGTASCPVLLFVSDGRQVSPGWIGFEEEFAKETGAEVVRLDCGHYVHYYESGRIAEKIREFVGGCKAAPWGAEEI